MGDLPAFLTRLAHGHSLKFLRFVAVGLLNTAVGYAIYLGGLALGLKPSLALAVAWVLGTVFNYFSTGGIVFRTRGLNLLPRFLASNAALYGFNLLLLEAAMRLGAPAWAAQGLVMPVVTVANYLVLSFLVFQVKAS